VLKILFVMALFQQPLTPGRMLLVVGVAILVGVVTGAIPSGGMIGEMVILSVFQLPLEALPLLASISIIIDPPATLLNATGDNAAAMLVARATDGAGWQQRTPPPTPRA
jgi:Na+/H+-dicarboxylate symporter